jgi:hypothetical protein
VWKGTDQKTALWQLAHNKRLLSKLPIVPMEQIAKSDLPQHINSQSQLRQEDRQTAVDSSTSCSGNAVHHGIQRCHTSARHISSSVLLLMVALLCVTSHTEVLVLVQALDSGEAVALRDMHAE